MKQKFININVYFAETKASINGLCIPEATGQQLNAVLQLAPVDSIVEIQVKERVVDNSTVK